MRAIVFVLPFLALPAWAEDFTLNAPVTDVTVYPQGAKLVRSGQLALPAGAHRILMPLTGGMGDAGLPQVTMTGAVTILGSAVIPGMLADPQGAYLPAQTAARAAVETAENDVTARKAVLEAARAALPGVEAQLAFLRSATAEGLTALDADTMVNMSMALGSQITALETQKLEMTENLRPQWEGLRDAELVLAQAKTDLNRLTPPQGAVDMVAVSVFVAEQTDASVSISALTYAAGWAPEYDLHLTTGADAALGMVRKVAVYQSSGTPWQDIRLHLSTADPTIPIAPNTVYQDQIVLFDNAKARRFESESQPMMEPAIVMQDERMFSKGLSAPAPAMETAFQTVALPGGLSVQYDYPVPVSVLSGNERLVLNLDRLDLPAEPFVRAVPKYDSTAFLMATVTNTLAEPILPGQAALYRDGTFIGQSQMPLIVASAEEDLPFGALENIRLTYRPLQNDTGDRGLISTSNTRKQSMEFTVENLMTTEQTVQTLFALPYSEQEDLVVTARARPQVTEADWDKQRGIGRWALTLAPGQKQTVQVDVDLRWPDGQSVNWQP